MNALIGFRANASGALNPTPEDRAEVARELTALSRAKALAPLRARVQALSETAAKSAAQAPAKSDSVSSTDTAQARAVNTQLDRDAFLQLLVTEMQHQDPLEPVDNSEMLAQLAQFSALEQMTHLNDSFEELSGNIDQLNFISAGQLLGRSVEAIDVEGNAVEGEVERVQLNGSVVYLTVDGATVSMAGVLSME